MSAQLELAYHLREVGMARATVGATNVDEDWPTKAMTFLRKYAETHERFPMFFVVQAAKELAYVNPRAWGPVTQKAIRAGVIAKTDKMIAHPARHACPAYVFESRVYRGVASVVQG